MRQRLRGVYFKNFIHIALLLCLTLLSIGVLVIVASYNLVFRNRVETMENNAATSGKLVSACIEEWGGAAEQEVHAMMQWMNETTGFQVLVTNGGGDVVSCSDEMDKCEHIGATVPSDFISTINIEGKFSASSTLGGLFSEECYVVGMALPGEHSEYGEGYIFLSCAINDMLTVWYRLLSMFMVGALIVAVLAFLLSFVSTVRQTKPIKQIAEAAEKFGRGDFSARVETGYRDDEIGELAESFNAMADSLEQSERSRRELIANVSHELKTPMTTITGFADGILDGTIPPEKERDYLAVISSETKRLSRLVRGMLDMSQLQDGNGRERKMATFDVSEVICQTLLSLEKKITDRGLDVEPQLPEEPVNALGDKDAITQVIYNLIDNAAKFASPGSSIGIALWKEGGKAYISVENKGETISQDELPLIFERFHKTDRSRNMDRDGVGLGLYIVKTILDSHDENIYVTSKDGITKFVFTLKLASGKNNSERSRQPAETLQS